MAQVDDDPPRFHAKFKPVEFYDLLLVPAWCMVDLVSLLEYISRHPLQPGETLCHVGAVCIYANSHVAVR